MWVYPAKHAHYAWTGDEEAILQVQFTARGASITSTRLTIRARSSSALSGAKATHQVTAASELLVLWAPAASGHVAAPPKA